MENDELKESRRDSPQGDLGTAPYGNFRCYYSFNPAEARLALIPQNLLYQLFPETTTSLAILDVGCNSGGFAVAFYQHVCTCSPPVHLLGLDLDPWLISQARSTNSHPQNIRYEQTDITDPIHRDVVLQDFLGSLGREPGPLDLSLCLSVTMWIHLHHGDAGLKAFLAWLSANSRWILVEPQPWRCYRAAGRRLRRLGQAEPPALAGMLGRPRARCDVKAFLCEECGMRFVKSFGDTTWGRPMLLFGRNTRQEGEEDQDEG
uniref:RNA 5'-monophosphate methyltransferase n=1 Tax=Myxine glutinosa TaxID=7769 RepID=UPI00358F62D3